MEVTRVPGGFFPFVLIFYICYSYQFGETVDRKKKNRRIDVKYSEVGEDYGSSSWRAVRAKTKAGMLFPSFSFSSGSLIPMMLETFRDLLLQSWLDGLFVLIASIGRQILDYQGLFFP